MQEYERLSKSILKAGITKKISSVAKEKEKTSKSVASNSITKESATVASLPSATAKALVILRFASAALSSRSAILESP
jgi:hypothetical protein